jgi:chromosome segregation ATPase
MRPLVEFCRHPRLAPDRNVEQSRVRALPALKLVGELDAIRRESRAKDGQLVELSNLLRQAETEIAHRDTALELKQSEIASLRDTVDAVSQRAAELGQLHEVKDAEIAKLASDLRTAEAAALQLREAKDAEVGAVRDELERVRAEAHAQHVESLEAMQRLKDDRHVETAALREELARTKHDALARRAQDLQAADEMRRAHDASLQAMREANEAELANLRARLDAISRGRVVRFLNGISRVLRGRPFI